MSIQDFTPILLRPALYDSGSDRPDTLLDEGRAPRLGGLIDGEQWTCRRRKLIGSDSSRTKYIFRDRNRRHRIRPAGIEREMGDDFGNLACFDAVVERLRCDDNSAI
jgi:hypothetical protein